MLAGSLRYSYLQYILPAVLPKDLDATVFPTLVTLMYFILARMPKVVTQKYLPWHHKMELNWYFNNPESDQDNGKGADRLLPWLCNDRRPALQKPW